MINTAMQALGDEPSAIRELFAYGLERKAQIGDENVFDFSLGNPSVPTPPQVAELIRHASYLPPQYVHGYTPAAGLPSTRTAIAESLNRRFATNYTANNLYLTCGAAASISISLKAILEAGDEVIVIAPFFPEYAVWIEAHGAKLVKVPARTEDFQPDVQAIQAAITSRTKAIIVNSPNNPVGVIYTPEVLAELAAVLDEASAANGRPIFLISDEPYRELAFGSVKPSWMPSVYANTLVCYSWSKSLSLPGERIGYILVPDSVENARSVYAAVNGAGRALGFVCAPALFQYVVERCPDLVADRSAYERNRTLITQVMDEAGFDYIAPDGAFYLWVRSPLPDAQEVSKRALAHELLIVPSDSFGVTGWLRLGYCVSEQTIVGSLEAFKKLRSELA